MNIDLHVTGWVENSLDPLRIKFLPWKTVRGRLSPVGIPIDRVKQSIRNTYTACAASLRANGVAIPEQLPEKALDEIQPLTLRASLHWAYWRTLKSHAADRNWRFRGINKESVICIEHTPGRRYTLLEKFLGVLHPAGDVTLDISGNPDFTSLTMPATALDPNSAYSSQTFQNEMLRAFQQARGYTTGTQAMHATIRAFHQLRILKHVDGTVYCADPQLLSMLNEACSSLSGYSAIRLMTQSLDDSVLTELLDKVVGDFEPAVDASIALAKECLVERLPADIKKARIKHLKQMESVQTLRKDKIDGLAQRLQQTLQRLSVARETLETVLLEEALGPMLL
jgi:hypothetical protein